MKRTEAVPTAPAAGTLAHPGAWRRALGFQNISAVYIFIVIFIVFALWVPQLFLKPETWAGLLTNESLTVMAAIAVMIPLVTGVFNLAIGAEISFALMLCATLQQTATEQPNLVLAFGLPWELAAAITVVMGAFIGFVSGVVVTKLKIDSFIATLGMSSILAGCMYLVSQNKPFGIPADFKLLYQAHIPVGNFRITLPVIILIVVALVTWYVLERTPVGRRMYATGFNAEGARLSGVNVERLRMGSLIAGGVIAAIVGVLAASKGGANALFGASMLIPALSAVFLGSTQFRGGRFNVWGTVVALYVLAVGVTGLLLVKVPDVLSDFFYGIALIGAVVLSRWEGGKKRTRAIRQATTFTAEGKAKLAAEDREDSGGDRTKTDA